MFDKVICMVQCVDIAFNQSVLMKAFVCNGDDDEQHSRCSLRSRIQIERTSLQWSTNN